MMQAIYNESEKYNELESSLNNLENDYLVYEVYFLYQNKIFIYLVLTF